MDAHSTMSLGAMVGLDNGFGVKGIAAKAQIGYMKYGGREIVNLRNYLEPGDVIHLGTQAWAKGGWCTSFDCMIPIEWYTVVMNGIRHLIEEKGIHVILEGMSCAGSIDWVVIITDNQLTCVVAATGNVDLDHPAFEGWYSRGNDTGSIYVGSAGPTTGRRSAFSNYGSRVDLFSWGKAM